MTAPRVGKNAVDCGGAKKLAQGLNLMGDDQTARNVSE